MSVGTQRGGHSDKTRGGSVTPAQRPCSCTFWPSRCDWCQELKTAAMPLKHTLQADRTSTLSDQTTHTSTNNVTETLPPHALASSASIASRLARNSRTQHELLEPHTRHTRRIGTQSHGELLTWSGHPVRLPPSIVSGGRPQTAVLPASSHKPSIEPVFVSVSMLNRRSPSLKSCHLAS